MKKQSLATAATIAAAIFLSLSTSGCIIVTDGNDSDFTVVNDSDFVITELYMVEDYSRTWGPDFLRGDVLLPNEQITIAVDCGIWDVLVVDEFQAQCQLLNIDLCNDSDGWVIDNFTLNTCAFGVRDDSRTK